MINSSGNIEDNLIRLVNLEDFILNSIQNDKEILEILYPDDIDYSRDLNDSINLNNTLLDEVIDDIARLEAKYYSIHGRNYTLHLLND